MEALFEKIRQKAPQYLEDLYWLIDQRSRGAFVRLADYRKAVLGEDLDPDCINEECAVPLEVSALQYFPWVRPMLEQAIANQTLVPGRFIAVRKMKESEMDGDLPAIVAALDISELLCRNAGYQRHRRLQPAPGGRPPSPATSAASGSLTSTPCAGWMSSCITTQTTAFSTS
jgi:hypothetical protein